MNDATPSAWWELHLRKARGELLSEAELQRYEAELALHDRESLARHDLETMKKTRNAAAALALENAHLHARADRLQEEIRSLEQALSLETRKLLGVGE